MDVALLKFPADLFSLIQQFYPKHHHWRKDLHEEEVGHRCEPLAKKDFRHTGQKLGLFFSRKTDFRRNKDTKS